MWRLINWSATTLIFGFSGYAYLSYHTKKNLKEYNEILEAGALKDASRLTN